MLILSFICISRLFIIIFAYGYDCSSMATLLEIFLFTYMHIPAVCVFLRLSLFRFYVLARCIVCAYCHQLYIDYSILHLYMCIIALCVCVCLLVVCFCYVFLQQDNMHDACARISVNTLMPIIACVCC